MLLVDFAFPEVLLVHHMPALRTYFYSSLPLMLFKGRKHGSNALACFSHGARAVKFQSKAGRMKSTNKIREENTKTKQQFRHYNIIQADQKLEGINVVLLRSPHQTVFSRQIM